MSEQCHIYFDPAYKIFETNKIEDLDIDHTHKFKIEQILQNQFAPAFIKLEKKKTVDFLQILATFFLMIFFGFIWTKVIWIVYFLGISVFLVLVNWWMIFDYKVQISKLAVDTQKSVDFETGSLVRLDFPDRKRWEFKRIMLDVDPDRSLE